MMKTWEMSISVVTVKYNRQEETQINHLRKRKNFPKILSNSVTMRKKMHLFLKLDLFMRSQTFPNNKFQYKMQIIN